MVVEDFESGNSVSEKAARLLQLSAGIDVVSDEFAAGGKILQKSDWTGIEYGHGFGGSKIEPGRCGDVKKKKTGGDEFDFGSEETGQARYAERPDRDDEGAT